ncbi:MAG: MarR family transcriptional regulator [Nitrospirota bacterium]|nr:MarR family transcriptional regulator [Nitrospirota bacterium]
MTEAITHPPLPSPPFLKILRPLVEAYQAFLQVSDRHIAKMGLTRGQFDVIVTLGRTNGLRCTDLARETLVTKGTLTGVLTRLEKKNLIYRTQNPNDRRGQIIRLTREGDSLFEKVFPTHISHLETYFNRALSEEDMDRLRPLLLKINAEFRSIPESPKSCMMPRKKQQGGT